MIRPLKSSHVYQSEHKTTRGYFYLEIFNIDKIKNSIGGI
jgi:hypothetical protein